MEEKNNSSAPSGDLRAAAKLVLDRYDELRGARAPAAEFEALRAALATQPAEPAQGVGLTDARIEDVMNLAHSWAQAAYHKALGMRFEDIDAIKSRMRAILARQTAFMVNSAAINDAAERSNFEARYRELWRTGKLVGLTEDQFSRTVSGYAGMYVGAWWHGWKERAALAAAPQAHAMVYADNLRELFTHQTDMNTSL